MTNDLDLQIKNGRIIGGTGNPYYEADIGLAGVQFVAIARDIGRQTNYSR